LTPDRGKIEVLQGDVARLRKRIRANLAAHRAEVLKVLTPEQQEQVQGNRLGKFFLNKDKHADFGRQQNEGDKR